MGEGLSETELMALGHEVGIPDLYLQRALVEERVRIEVTPEQGMTQWLLGPRALRTGRVVTHDADKIAQDLNHWMTEKELLTVKRRFQGATSWEPKKGFFTSVQRELGMGGKQYVLADAEEISAQVVPTAGHTHVQLTASLDNTRRAHVQTGIALAGIGTVLSAVGFTLGVAVFVAAIPAIVGLIGGVWAMRRRHGKLERVQVGLEQVLDKLEHDELGPPPAPKRGELPETISRIAKEIKKNLGV